VNLLWDLLKGVVEGSKGKHNGVEMMRWRYAKRSVRKGFGLKQ
jgi:hypothetical protein